MSDTTRSVTDNRAAASRGSAEGRGQPCCGGPAPVATNACCARDAEVKSAGGTGCGCGSATTPAAGTSACCG